MSSALIVIPDSNSRGKVKTIATQSGSFREAKSVTTLDDAMAKLRGEERFGAVILSSDFNRGDLSKFLDEATNHTPRGRESAYILLLKPNEQSSANVADNLIVGIHAFLCEPLSAETMEEIADIARRVSMENSSTRLKVATGLIITSVLQEQNPNRTRDPNMSIVDQVRASFDEFAELTGEDMSIYIDGMARTLAEVNPSERIGYDGVSKRVRKLFERRLLEKLQKIKGANVKVG